MRGVFINFPTYALLLASHIPRADIDVLRRQATCQRWQFGQQLLHGPAGRLSPFENFALLFHSPRLLPHPQETSLPLGKRSLLAAHQENPEQLYDNNHIPLQPSWTWVIIIFSFHSKDVDVKGRSTRPSLLSLGGSVMPWCVKVSSALDGSPGPWHACSWPCQCCGHLNEGVSEDVE